MIKKVLSKVLTTDDSAVAFILRVTLGFVMLPHGLQKTLGLFGGPGFSGEMNFFTETLGIPWIFAFAAIVAESLGSIGLICGFFTRISAFLIGSTMVVAAAMEHIPNGFFMNWFGNQKGEGFEYHILVVGLALGILVLGGGKFSIDKEIA